MCGRYVIISSTEKIEKKFQVKFGASIEKNYNLSAGQLAPVITSENPRTLELLHFGFTPSWAAKKTYVLNARAEGDWNKENNPIFNGAKGIITKPYFRKAIRSKRCLVLADAFIEGTAKDKLNNPFLVYLRNKERPFAMAGVYDEWLDVNTREIYKSFAIITCPPNQLLQKLPHHRMPVILSSSEYKSYLNVNTSLSTITRMLTPYDASLMNAYPISSEIRKVSCNKREALNPTGETIFKEYKEVSKNSVVLMPSKKDSRRDSLYGKLYGK